MNITDVKIRRLYNEGNLRAKVSITVDNALAVHDIKVLEGERLFIAMPSRKAGVDTYADIVHPINSEARKQIEAAILEQYLKVLKEQEQQIAAAPAHTEPAEPAETAEPAKAPEAAE